MWQGKDLWEGDFVCVAAEGLRREFFVYVAAKELTSNLSRKCEQVELPRIAVTPHPPGFCIDVRTNGLRKKGFVRP